MRLGTMWSTQEIAGIQADKDVVFECKSRGYEYCKFKLHNPMLVMAPFENDVHCYFKK